MDSNPNTDPINLELPSPFFRLYERTNFAPRVFTSPKEIFQTKCNSHIRSLAPYVLEVHRGEEKFYFQYAAAICKKQYEQTNSELLTLVRALPYTVQRQISKPIQIPDKVICIVFDVQPDNHLISYGGYFEVKPQALFRFLGQTNTAVREIKDTSSKCLNKSQLGILGMANKVLASFNEYYVNGDFAKVFVLSNNRTRNYLMSKDSKHVLCEEDEILIDDDEPAAAKITGSIQSPQEGHSSQQNTHQVNDSDDPVVVTVISASSMTKDFKHRTQVVFNQSDLMQVSAAISERSLLKNLLTTAEAFARFGSTAMMSEFSCRDLLFCPTKYYAGIEGYGDKYFFQRVFVIGHVDDRAIVLPYSNAKERRDLILQSPFATRAIFRRFKGDERTETDIVKKVNVAELSLQQVHIPTFVPAHDAARILRYWSSCYHILTKRPDLIRSKLDPFFSSNHDFPGTSSTSRKQIFQEEKDPLHSTESKSLVPSIIKSPRLNSDVIQQKAIAQVPVHLEEISVGSDESRRISSSPIDPLSISSRSAIGSKDLLQARIDEFFPFDFQNSLYRFPDDWSDPHAVNKLFCENLLRNVVQSCLRVCLGLNSARDYTFFIPDQFTPLKFIEFCTQFFNISEKDTFICHILTKIENSGSSKFCKQVTFKNLYSHIIRSHLKLPTCRKPQLDSNTCFSNRSMDFLPFSLSPGTVTPKPENPATLRKLQRLNVIISNQKAQGVGFFKTIEEAKIKKCLQSQEKTSNSSSEKNAQASSIISIRDSVKSEEQENQSQPPQQSSSDAIEPLDIKPEINCADKRRFSYSSDLSFEEPVKEKEDKTNAECSKQSTNGCLSLQSANETAEEEDISGTYEEKDPGYCELVDQFIPMREVHDTLNSFITDWTKAYIGNTEYVAECPLLEKKETRRFFPNVIILGTHADYFFVMPLKNDMLSCKMTLGLPFATQKIFSRKNRHMPQVKVGEVVLQLPESVKQRMSVEEYEKCVQFQQLFSLGPISVHLEVCNKCELLIK